MCTLIAFVSAGFLGWLIGDMTYKESIIKPLLAIIAVSLWIYSMYSIGLAECRP